MIIFKGPRLKAEWRADIPSGVTLTCSKDGWINKELFLDFGRMFVESWPHAAGRKPVMLLDGHGINIDINPNHQNGRSRTLARTW